MSRSFDCLVLGAGFVGLGAALALQERGRSVAILDRLGHAAGETSYGNTGIIQSEAVHPYTFPRKLGEIASAAQEQSSALQQINSAIDQMSGNTQANAAMAEESTAAGHTLSEESRGLVKLMQQFRVGAPPSGGRAAARKFAA